MPIADIANGEIGSSVRAKLNSLIALFNGTREILTASRTYYVRTDGSDSNNGLTNTAGGAFLTWQGAIDAYARSVDHAGYNVTIQAGQASQTFTLTSSLILKKAIGSGTLTLDLNGGTWQLASSNTANRALIEAASISNVVVKNGKSANIYASLAAWNTHLWMSDSAIIEFNDWNWGDLNSSAGGFSQHILVEGNANLLQSGTYTISGGDISAGTSASSHYNARFDGLITVAETPTSSSSTVTVSGTPKFSDFAQFTSGGKWQGYQITWGSGVASGVRKYLVNTGGGLNTFGGLVTYPFPGSVSGVVTSPGWVA